MGKLLVLLFFVCSIECSAQKDSTKWIRAFPITSYILDIADSIKLVQIKLPVGTTINEKQVGLLKGVYKDKYTDTATIGSGR